MSMSIDRNSKTSGNGRHTAVHPPGSETSAARSDDDPGQGETTEATALRLLLEQFRSLGEYFSYYLAALSDSFKLTLRSTFIGMTFGAIGFVSISGLILIASWFVLSGIAVGLGELFGERTWVGNIISGCLLLAGLGGAMYYALSKYAGAACDRTIKKYEKRQIQQQSRFGRSVSDSMSVPSSEK